MIILSREVMLLRDTSTLTTSFDVTSVATD